MYVPSTGTHYITQQASIYISVACVWLAICMHDYSMIDWVANAHTVLNPHPTTYCKSAVSLLQETDRDTCFLPNQLIRIRNTKKLSASKRGLCFLLMPGLQKAKRGE